MASKTQLAALFLCLSISISISSTAAVANKHKPQSRRPCQELVFYIHDIQFNGHNYDNATAAIVGSPAWGNKTAMAPNFYGDMVVFDNPITLDNNLHSPPVGRAQGMYFYDQKSTFGRAWLTFSFTFNSTDHVGTLNFAGADPLMKKTRDISVFGGTGDFFMAQGVTTLSTDSFETNVYFRLRVDVNLYE